MRKVFFGLNETLHVNRNSSLPAGMMPVLSSPQHCRLSRCTDKGEVWSVANFTSIGVGMWDTALKPSKFGTLPMHFPLVDEPFARFLWNSQRFCASTRPSRFYFGCFHATKLHAFTLDGDIFVCLMLWTECKLTYVWGCVCVCVSVILSVNSPTGQTPQRIFTVDCLKDANLCKDVPFGGIDDG